MVKNTIIKNFIVFEGLDGAGTTTQTELLDNRFKQFNIPCKSGCEPTRGFIGKTIRQVLSGNKKVALGTIAKLFVSDRHEHLYNPTDGILTLCEAGNYVISDRYLFSSLAYQSLDYGFENVLALNSDFPLPEHLFFLDVPPEICQQRLRNRESLEIYENNELQEKILKNYRKSLELYSNSGMFIHILNGTVNKYELEKIIWSKVYHSPIK